MPAITVIVGIDECQRSRYADDMVELKYAPDLVVQGIITVRHSHHQPLAPGLPTTQRPAGVVIVPLLPSSANRSHSLVLGLPHGATAPQV